MKRKIKPTQQHEEKSEKNARNSNIYCRTKQTTTTLVCCLGHATLQTQAHKIYFKREEKMKNAFFNGSSTHTPSDCTYIHFFFRLCARSPALFFSTGPKCENERIAFTFEESKQWTLFAWTRTQKPQSSSSSNNKSLWILNIFFLAMKLFWELFNFHTDFNWFCEFSSSPSSPSICADHFFVFPMMKFMKWFVSLHFGVATWARGTAVSCLVATRFQRTSLALCSNVSARN